MIKDVADSVTAGTRLFITDTKLIDVEWIHQYNDEGLGFATFQGLNNKIKSLSVFTGNQGFEAMETEETLYLKILGKNDNNLFVKMPKTLAETAAKLTVTEEDIKSFKADKEFSSFQMPVFNFETEFDVLEALKNKYPQMAQSFKTIFNDKEELTIGAFKQKAKIEVTPKGMKAAAVTKVEFVDECCVSTNTKEAIINKAFGFVIEKNNKPLFHGQFVDPTGQYQDIEESCW